jgi:gluconate kinase
VTERPIIEVNGNSDNDLERAQWLHKIYDAACQHVRDRDEPVHEVCY